MAMLTISVFCFAEYENYTRYFFICFSAKSTIRHDLDSIFTENVKVFTKFINVITKYDLIK